jgi:predicted lipid carrier protein YhbT
VHRFDAQSATGTPDPLAPALAAEGIDEYLTGLLPRIARRQPLEGLAGTFHAHTTDTEGEWVLDFGAEGLSVRREHAKADTAVRGPASGLYLWMLNRQSVDEAGLEVFGDRSVIDAWRNLRF